MVKTPSVGEERGVIVKRASVAAFDGQLNQAACASSQAASLASPIPNPRDLAQHLIGVVTFAPGLLTTPLLASLTAEAMASVGAQVPHASRLGEPHENAALVAPIVAIPVLNDEVTRLDEAIYMAPR